MRRREFVAGLGGTAAWPIRAFGAHGQQETFGGSHSKQHLVHALVLLVAFGIFAATPTKAAQTVLILLLTAFPFEAFLKHPRLRFSKRLRPVIFPGCKHCLP